MFLLTTESETDFHSAGTLRKMVIDVRASTKSGRATGYRPNIPALLVVTTIMTILSASIQTSPAWPSPAAGTGEITLDELAASPIDLPPWGTPAPGDIDPLPPCPTSGVTIHPSYVGMQEVNAEQLEYGDIDHDRVRETIVLIECPVYQSGRQQVVALDRDPSGAIVLLGQVVGQGIGAGTIKHLEGFVLSRPDRVGVTVSDRQPCCGAATELGEYQLRWYSWRGDKFAQTGGPRQFHPVPADYGKPTTTIAPLVLGPAVNGRRVGSTSALITNPGPASTPGIRVEIVVHEQDFRDLPEPVQITVKGTRCVTGTTMSKQSGLICHLPALAAQGTRTLSLTVRSPVIDDPLIARGVIQVRVSPEQPGIRVLTAGYDGSWSISEISLID